MGFLYGLVKGFVVLLDSEADLDDLYFVFHCPSDGFDGTAYCGFIFIIQYPCGVDVDVGIDSLYRFAVLVKQVGEGFHSFGFFGVRGGIGQFFPSCFCWGGCFCCGSTAFFCFLSCGGCCCGVAALFRFAVFFLFTLLPGFCLLLCNGFNYLF